MPKRKAAKPPKPPFAAVEVVPEVAPDPPAETPTATAELPGPSDASSVDVAPAVVSVYVELVTGGLTIRDLDRGQDPQAWAVYIGGARFEHVRTLDGGQRVYRRS